MIYADLKNKKVEVIEDDETKKKVFSDFLPHAEFCVHCGIYFNDFENLAIPHRLEDDPEIVVCQNCKKELKKASDEVVDNWLKEYKKNFIKYPLKK